MPENPYVTPSSQISISPSYGWQICENSIHAGASAQLPAVDIFTGETGQELITRAVTIKVIPRWSQWFQGTASALYIVAFTSDNPFLNVFLMLGAAVANVILFAQIAKHGSCRLEYLCTRKTGIKSSAPLAALVIFLGTLIIVPFHGIDISSPSYALLLLISVGVLFSLRFLVPHLTCRRKINGSFEIRGLHPDALTYLREEELKQSNSSQSAAPSHT